MEVTSFFLSLCRLLNQLACNTQISLLPSFTGCRGTRGGKTTPLQLVDLLQAFIKLICCGIFLVLKNPSKCHSVNGDDPAAPRSSGTLQLVSNFVS